MSRYVINPDVALALAEREAVIPPRHQLLAPTLLRNATLGSAAGKVVAVATMDDLLS